MSDAIAISTKRETAERLRAAVGAGSIASREGLFDHLFALAFSGLVYAQIWEDPEADMDALDIGPESHVVTIASGGCNVLSYLTARPARITAVDLNPAHVALTRLKLAAASALPDHASFARFFADPDRVENITAYDRHLADRLDPSARDFWEARRFGNRRIGMFAGNIYEHGLLGRFIGLAHLVARAYGVDPRIMLTATTMAEQREIFDREIAPLFQRGFLRWLVGRTISLYGLGIPPAQYAALAGGRHMADVLLERLRRLACDFDLSTNYFAHQAFGRTYGSTLPPYLEAWHFDTLRETADRVAVLHRSMTEFLAGEAEGSVDRVVLLDAQDWMSDAQLGALWAEITRTARPGARVVFRTAAEPDLLPGRVPDEILSRWHYDAEGSATGHARDRSGIYGGFHLYRLKEGGQ
ncbi:MAG TPA: DUF3419 family protein [Kaistiaceae bacterium]|nr:DUF3419 family protein [Kaistiaceae bacterium]